jgi:hypothetical protein
VSETLDALERQGDNLERYYEASRQANDWMREHRTDELVGDLKKASANHRPMHLGTINTLILLAHIEQLETELAKEPIVKG